MIVLDSSAALAVLLAEGKGQDVLGIMKTATPILMSPANALECVMRLAPRPGLDRTQIFERMLVGFDVQIVSVDTHQFELARAGFITYGKGRHPAGLNFGDCFAYALAKHRDAPLLFVGDDFSRTDVKAAL